MVNSIIVSNAGAVQNCAAPEVQGDDTNIDYGDPENSCYGEDVNPELSGLASNGGPVQTMAISSASPAIGLVPSGSCSAATDLLSPVPRSPTGV